MPERFDVAIVGSGFAGSILARGLAARGQRVVLFEQSRHPRFALGESSTPLAAIALERLAEHPGLADLRALAAYGRWQRELPHLTCGLKRGFTFFGHGSSDERLLVAASPNDEVADTHWLRADVDAHLASAAVAAGVDLREGVTLTAAEERREGLHLRGSRQDVLAAFVVDASGPAGFLAKALGLAPRPGRTLNTQLIFGHFEGVRPLAELNGVPFAWWAGELPYPPERAAVHHLLAEGWMYQLPFDSGVVSAGFELTDPVAGPAEQVFDALCARYPVLAAQFRGARACFSVNRVERVQYGPARAVGARWLMLPHAYSFSSPLYSTGMAWSLVGVERALHRLAEGPARAAALLSYEDLLAAEARYLERLITGALAARSRFPAFAAWSLLYFAAASFEEARQRLLPAPPGGWAEAPFLGVQDPASRAALAHAEVGLRRCLVGELAEQDFAAALRSSLTPRDVAGLSRPHPDGLYGVDLGDLVTAAGRLGLTAEQVRRALPRLRGEPRAAETSAEGVHFRSNCHSLSGEPMIAPALKEPRVR